MNRVWTVPPVIIKDYEIFGPPHHPPAEMMSADIPKEMIPVQQGKIRKALSEIHTKEEFDKLFSEATDGTVKQEPLKGGSVANVLKKMEEEYPGFAPQKKEPQDDVCTACASKNPFQQIIKHMEFYREFVHILGLQKVDNQRLRDEFFNNSEFLDDFIIEEFSEMTLFEKKNNERKKRIVERMEMLNKSMVSVFINKK